MKDWGLHMSFYTDVIQQDPRFQSTHIIDDMNLLEPVTRQKVQAIIDDAKTVQGIDLMVFETYRSQERQGLLFQQGASKLQKVGVHHFGLAADLVKNINGKPSWKGDFSFMAHLAFSPNTFDDDDHVQRIWVGRQASLFRGTFYPDENYDPYRDH
jgi:hypothetical protein